MKVYVKVQQSLNNLLNRLLCLSFYWVTIKSNFSFLQYKFLKLDVIIVFNPLSASLSKRSHTFKGLKQIGSLEDETAPFTKKWKKHKLIGIISFP